MGTKLFRKDGYLYNEFGVPVTLCQSTSGDRAYAVIAACGHCGDGFYIPIVFPRFCQSKEAAIESVKSIPRVKRDKRDFVLDAFEISDVESMFLNCINDRDPYLKGYFTKDDRELQDRRIVRQDVFDEIVRLNKHLDIRDILSTYQIKTADEYYNNLAIQRFYAPRLQGNKLVFPKSVNRQEMIDEYYKQCCIRFGLKKNNVAIISLYYQMYGEDNPLGIKYRDKKFIYEDRWHNIFFYEIEDKYLLKIIKAGLVDERGPIIKPEVEEQLFESSKPVQKVSAVDKFNRRFKKFEEIKNKGKKPPVMPEGGQPGNG